VLAQENLRVLPSDGNDPPRQRLYRWLQNDAQQHFDARRKAVAALKTPADVIDRQSHLREQFLTALGGLPERTPLNPRVTGQLQRDGYRIEKVIYESRPQHHVTANLYVPDGKGPFPGVLVPCGHSANGKAAEAYQKICILLARHGFVTLIYDPIGQGERIQLLDELGQPTVKGSTSEHTMIGIGALLVGSSCATYRIWDGIRSLDYLASHPEVDPQRLGCTGNSGGGTLTAYLMALDDRIQVAAPSCYITSLERLFETIGPQDAEQNITGQVAFGMEHADYITLRAPKPTLICVGTQDFFDITGAWTTYREVKGIYGKLGYGERVDLFEFDDQHGFSMPRRVAALRWMRRWLQNQNDAPVEIDGPFEKDADLQVTRTGQVLTDAQGISAYDLNRLAEEQHARHRSLHPLRGQELNAAIRQLLHLPDSLPTAQVVPLTDHAVVPRSGYAIRKLLVTVDNGLSLPVHVWQPAKSQGRPLVYLHDQGKLAEAQPGGELERLVLQGRTIIAVDLRGMGELAPAQANSSWAVPFGTDTREAFLALHLNRPLLGLRVIDVLNTLAAVPEAANSSEGVDLLAVGHTGPIALHAAVLEPRIREITLRKSLASWKHVAVEPINKHQLPNVVPNVLRQYDLPDLVAELQSRTQVTIQQPVNGRGEAVGEAKL